MGSAACFTEPRVFSGTLPPLSPDLNSLCTVHLTGTKLGCAEGGCGACTVMVSKLEEGEVKHISVNACLAPLCSVDGMAVTTVEGIGSTQAGLHPCQVRLLLRGRCTALVLSSVFSGSR